MATNIVTVSGMFGEVNGQIHTYFADSPVVIDIRGLQWPGTSPFNIVRVEVVYNNNVVGNFRADTNGQSSINFDISSALRAIWSDYDFGAAGAEIAKANAALTGLAAQSATRNMRTYYLRIFTEYLSSDDGGVFTTTQCEDAHGNKNIPGGQCLLGWLTEWERSTIEHKEDADVSHWEHTGVRNGDASTKPTSSPERVGRNSLTSWVDVRTGMTKSIFYPASYNNGIGEPDDIAGIPQGWTGHAPLVLRDSQPYVDFLFVNRRGAVETCSGLMFEGQNINIDSQQYARVERPKFMPSRSLMNIRQGGPRRAWDMSSGFVEREWAEWWAIEFLQARQWWMRYPIGSATGTYVPVVVEPTKKSIGIYDRAKQQMPHVDFTVTLALEG